MSETKGTASEWEREREKAKKTRMKDIVTQYHVSFLIWLFHTLIIQPVQQQRFKKTISCSFLRISSRSLSHSLFQSPLLFSTALLQKLVFFSFVPLPSSPCSWFIYTYTHYSLKPALYIRARKNFLTSNLLCVDYVAIDHSTLLYSSPTHKQLDLMYIFFLEIVRARWIEIE